MVTVILLPWWRKLIECVIRGNGDFTMDTNESKAEFTSLIKRSVQYQCKYCVDGDFQACQTLQPGNTVPHPMNRGGVACGSLRTRQISSIIVEDGFDVMMAKQNAVAVQVNPQKPDYFQKHFEGTFTLLSKHLQSILKQLVSSSPKDG